MVKEVEVEDEPLDCKTILLVGAGIIGLFAIWNFYNTSRLHDLVQQLLNRPDPVMRSHDGEHESEPENMMMRTHNGRDCY